MVRVNDVNPKDSDIPKSNNNKKSSPRRVKGYNYQKFVTYHPIPAFGSKSQGYSDEINSRNPKSINNGKIMPPESNYDSSDKSNDLGRGNDLLKRFLPEILRAISNKAIKDSPPTLHELEAYLQEYVVNLYKNTIKQNDSLSNNNPSQFKRNDAKESSHFRSNKKSDSGLKPTVSDNQNGQRFNIDFRYQIKDQNNLPIVTELISKGYLVDSDKWVNKRGFLKMGEQILVEIIKSLKAEKHGMHETKHTGYGSIIQESSRRFERGNELANINISATIRNFLERYYDDDSNKMTHMNLIKFPLDISYEDIEIYDTIEEVRVSTVYCIDLSSTMKYASMYSELNRIEASKRALWSLYILNKKFFPMDIIHTIGFGSIATRIDSIDIPFLKTFEPNADFLHYTNYQSAYRLAERILRKDGVKNKRIVMITDGHPSACFIDNNVEKDKILKQRPYSHFYKPERNNIGSQNSENNKVKFDINQKQLVYLCYRYRQIDQYIGEHTIKEAQKLRRDGIEIDTIMVSEEDSLLDFVNELAKAVDGKSIYINPGEIDKILITDYLSNKRKVIR